MAKWSDGFGVGTAETTKVTKEQPAKWHEERYALTFVLSILSYFVKTKFYYLCLPCIFLFSCLQALAVRDTVSSKESSEQDEKYRRYKFGVLYSSDNTFRGRRDTANIPLISPSFKYTARSGFFLQTSLVDVPTRNHKLFDELDAGSGWDIDFSDKWDGIISYDHYFFDSRVARIKAAVQNDLNVSTGFDWNILYSQLLFDINGGRKTFRYNGKRISMHEADYSVTLANDHDFDFYFRNNTRSLTLSPEADILMGTQNFLARYAGKTADAAYKKQASKFGLTAYIFYLDVIFTVHRLSMSIEPSYTIPKNVPGGSSSSRYFVLSGGVYYTFKSRHRK